ncbi:MAG: MFS transporter [Bacillota bacterium]|nr:MFS transporter [Bacillota bacterium]
MGKKHYFLYTKAFSEVGNMMEMIMMNTVVYSLTHSTTWLSAVLAARVVGGIISSLFSGILADRFNRRHLMIGSDLIRGLCVLSMCLAPTPILFVMTALVLGFFGTFFAVSFSAEIPQIFREEKNLEINAFISRLNAISMVVGFFASALLSNLVNYRAVVGLDSVTFFLSAFVLFFYKWDSNVKESGMPNWKQLFLYGNEVKQYLNGQKMLLLIFLVFLFQTFAASSQNVGIPMLSQELSAKHMTFYQGLIWGVWGIGSVLSTWIIPKIKCLKENFNVVYLGFSIFASAGFILLLSNKIIEVILLFSFFTGMFDAGSGTYFSVIVQQTENHIRGRIFGVANFLRGLGFTLGFVGASFFLKIISMPQMVWIFHGSTIVVILGSLTYLLTKKSQSISEKKVKGVL